MNQKIKDALDNLKNTAFSGNSTEDIVNYLSGDVGCTKYDANNPDHKILIKKIVEGLKLAILEVNDPENGFDNVKSLGNNLTTVLIKHLKSIQSLNADRPKSLDGNIKHSGYPNLYVKDSETGLISYITSKAVTLSKARDTVRSLYIGMPKNTQKFGVTEKGLHLLVSIFLAKDKENNSCLKVVEWKILDILEVELKFKKEFYQCNRKIYENQFLIQKGAL